MKKSYLIFAILSLLMISGAMILSGQSVRTYTNIPSLAMVTLTSVFLLLTNYSPVQIVRAFTIGFKKNGTDKKDLKRSLNLFDSLGKYLILSAILGSMTGFIAMLSFYAKDTSSIGSAAKWAGGSALAVLTILYSLIFYMIVVVPFRNGLKNKLVALEE